MSALTLKIRHRTARDLMAPLKEHDEVPAFRELLQVLERALGPEASDTEQHSRPERSFTGVRTRAPRPRGTTATRTLREQIWLRSEGRCECGCRTRITWNGFELDHFLGRARAAESPENCWALATDCHRAKHGGVGGDPNRVRWLWLFFLHLQAHGFGLSPTAERVGAELEAAELLEKAAAIRARSNREVNYG